MKEARIYASKSHLCASNNRKNQSEEREAVGLGTGWKWGKVDPLDDGNGLSRPGRRLHQSTLSKTGEIAYSKYVCFTGCNFHLNKKIKIDFLGNEGPLERMVYQRVADPLRLFSQPSKTVNVNYVS